MDRLCFSYPYSIEQVTLESSASPLMSRSILAAMLVFSAGLHLLFIALAPAPAELKDVERPRYTFTPLAGVGSVVSRIDKRIIGRALLTDLNQHYFEVYSDVVPLKKSDVGFDATVAANAQRE